MPTSRTRTFRLLLLACALLGAAMLQGAPRRGTAATEPDADADRPGQYPSDWFYAQRAFPDGNLNQDAYIAAVDRVTRERARLRASSGGETWQAAGPYNVGGRVTALAVAPGGSTIYLGSANGGVFRSDDAGVDWTSVFDQEFAFSIGALALDPTDPNIVYCGTGEANGAIDTYDGMGLYRTANGGTTWQYAGLQETRRIARVAVDPSDPNRIFVAGMGAQFTTGPDRGLYRSEDAGASWSKVLFVNDSTGCADVVINPAHPETVYCATWERVRRPTYRRASGPGCGIWRSIDSGTTWARLSTGLPAPGDNVGRIGLAIAASRPSMVYAQMTTGPAGGYAGLGMYRTADGGATWTRRDASGFVGNFSNFAWYFGDMAVDPNNSDKVYSLGLGVVRSTDGGVNFSGINGSQHVDEHAFWIDPANPNHLYLGSDGGFFYSTAGGGLSWMKAVTLDITQFYAGAIDATDPNRLLGGTQDNNTIWTMGSPTDWGTLLGGDGFYCLSDPTNPAVIIAEWQNCCDRGGPYRSTDSGVNFTKPTGINSGDRFNWCTPLVMNPKNHNVVLVGSQRVWRSNNNGQKYGAISPDLTTNNTAATLVYSTITTLDISPADTSTYYVGTDDGKVWRSTDRGGTWTDISAGLPIRWVTRVTADPADPEVVYVALSGFSQDEAVARLYRSTNRGATWASVSGNLPDVPVNDLVADPMAPEWLYAATDLGVYRSFDTGATWEPLGSGLPFTAVFDLTFNAPTRTLVAATHGRSQWKVTLDPPIVAVNPTPRPALPPLALSAPRPNPSHRETRLTLTLDSRAQAEVAVFDATGRRVRTLLSGRIEAGSHPLTWDGRDEHGGPTATGVYFVRARVAGSDASRRIVRVE